MKKIIIFCIVLILLWITISFPKLNTKDAFELTKIELKEYQLLADKNNTVARMKLYKYYNYSKQDFNKVMSILEKGAKLGNSKFQYKFARRLIYGVHISSYITEDKDNFELGVYWMKEAVTRGFEPAVNELKKLNFHHADTHHKSPNKLK